MTNDLRFLRLPLASIFIICLTFNASFAQSPPPIQWQKCFGGTGWEGASWIMKTSDSGYIAGGTSYSNDGQVTGHRGTTSHSDYWVVKMSSTGVLQWEKSLGGTNDEYLFCAQQTFDGGYILAGWSVSDDSDVTGHHADTVYNADMWIVKLSDTGSIEWENSFGGSGNDYAYSVIQTFDSGYIVAGSNNSTDGDVTGNHGLDDVWILKLSPNGSIVWEKSYGGSGPESASSIRQTPDSGYIFSASTSSSDGDVTYNYGDVDVWVVKLTPTGDITWQKTYGGSGSDDGACIRQTNDGGYVVTGFTNSTDGDITVYYGNYDYWVIKISDTGALLWQKTLGGSDWDTPYSIDTTIDGGYIVAGMSKSNDHDVTGNHGGYDYWVAKLSPSGTLQWERSYGGSGDEDVTPCILSTPDRGYILAGGSGSNNDDVSGNHGSDDFWIVKLTPDSLLTLGSKSISKIQSVTISPNPATNIITISGAGKVQINIYNTLGTLMEQAYDANVISISQLPSGLYFVKLFNDQGVLTKCEKLLKL